MAVAHSINALHIPSTAHSMTGIVVTGRGQFELREIPVPIPGPGEIRIKVLAAGICGTDVHITSGDESLANMMKPPVTLGHEFCGEIDAIGKDVKGFSEGDYVSAEMHVVCWGCPACSSGKHHACQHTKLLGLHGDGAFAEYVILPATNVVKLPRSIPVKVGAILDALGNAVHTASRTELDGRSVAIIGYGPIGAMATEITRFCKAKHIYIVDISPLVLQRAARWVEMRNANQTVTIINAMETNAVDEILGHTGGGVDVSLEFSGANSGINLALAGTRPGGDVSLLGIPKDKNVVIDDYGKNVIWKGLTLHGIIGRELFRTWEQMIDMLGRGLDIAPIVTGEYPLSQFKTGLERFKKGEEQKVVLFPGQ